MASEPLASSQGEMASISGNWTELALFDWSKGWHPEKPEALRTSGELAVAENIIYRENLVPEKRRGFTRIRAQSYGVGRVNGLVRYKPAGQAAYWVFAWQGALYTLTDGGDVTQIPGSTGLMVGRDYRFEVWKDKLYIVNGADGLLCWDGTTLVNLTTAPPPTPSQPEGFPKTGAIDEATATSITDFDKGWELEGVLPGDIITITSGAASGQTRTIFNVEGSVLYVKEDWNPIPSVGDTFEITTVVMEGISAPAGAAFVTQYADRLWIGSTAIEPDTVFYSRLLDDQNWNDPRTGIENLIDVSVGDNQRITGLVRAREGLLIFKERSIFYLQGYLPEEWYLERITDELGCIAPGSIAKLDSTVIWLSERGVYMDDGASFNRIGGEIDQWIEENLTRTQQSKALAVISGLHYILYFPDTPEGPVALVWNGRFENWVKWKLPSSLVFSAIASRTATGDSPGWVVGRNDQAIFYLGDSGSTDDGTNITAVLRSSSHGALLPQDVYQLRNIIAIISNAAGDSAEIRWIADGVQLGSANLSDGTTRISIPPGNLGDRLALEFYITGSGLGSKVYGASIKARIRRKKWS